MKGRIDPHVHFRDGKQAYKETIAHGLELAKSQGVEKVFDMPNTDPPILYKKDVEERINLALNSVSDEDYRRYFFYIGATADEGQLKEAVKCYDNYSDVIGIKMFAGQSVGDLAIIDEGEQRHVYRTLKELGYDGVLAVHCEKEAFLRPDLWKPAKPHTHCIARPREAEIESVKDQIKFSQEEDFEGHLHICHVTCVEVLELIEEVKDTIPVSCGATPHHLMFDSEIMKDYPFGLFFKMNPPLREKADVEGLRRWLKHDNIDWIETDHAPHAIGEKLYGKKRSDGSYDYPSGYSSLYIYKELVDKILPTFLSKEQIERLTRDNIKKVFGRKID